MPNAVFSLIGQTSLYWKVENLSSTFSPTNYQRVGLASSYFAQGATSVNQWSSTTTFTYTTSTGTILKSGLTAGTTYTGYVFAQAANGLYYRGDYFSVTTESLPTLSTPTLHTLNSTSTTIYVQINTVANANRYTIALNTGHSYDGPDPWTTFTNLNPSTSYGVRWKARDWTGNYLDSPYSSYSYISTQAATPIPSPLTGLYIEDVYATDITARWNISSNAKDYRIYLARGSTVIVENTYSIPTSYIFWNSTFNLQRGSQHTLTITPRNIDNILGTGQTIYFTPLASARPANWSWTTTELNAINGQGLFSTITATRWNAFLDRVQEFINYYNTKYGTGVYSVISGTSSPQTGNRNCKVSVSPPGILTANDFNHIRFCIGSMNSTGLSNFSTGQPVMGSYITTITTSLNGVD